MLPEKATFTLLKPSVFLQVPFPLDTYLTHETAHHNGVGNAFSGPTESAVIIIFVAAVWKAEI